MRPARTSLAASRCAPRASQRPALLRVPPVHRVTSPPLRSAPCFCSKPLAQPFPHPHTISLRAYSGPSSSNAPPSRLKVFPDGSRYEGDLKDGKPHGQGSFKSGDGSTYVGEFKDGRPEGFGVMTYAGGEEYRGEFKAGERHGRGLYTYNGGDTYDGTWQNGQRHGKGIYRAMDGSVYDGEWVADRKHGKGVLTVSPVDKKATHNGRYEGEWRHGHRHGQGTYEYPNGDRYVGHWERGQQHGTGTLFGHDGSKRDSAWRNGVQHGPGVYINPEGKAFKALWENGKGYIQEELVEQPLPQMEVSKPTLTATTTTTSAKSPLTLKHLSAGLDGDEGEAKAAAPAATEPDDELEGIKRFGKDPRVLKALADPELTAKLRAWGEGKVTAQELQEYPKMKDLIAVLNEIDEAQSAKKESAEASKEA